MKRLGYFIAVCLCIFWSCKPDEDPGPDLSGTISFTSYGDDSSTSYVVISDTTGNILGWQKLVNNVKASMPYPPGDSKLAHVTIIITRTYSTGDRRTTLDTYTGIVGDDYSLGDNLIPLPMNFKGEYKVTIPERSNYNIATVYLTNSQQTNYIDADNTLQFTNGVNPPTNDLFVMLQKITPRDYRYFYKPHILAGDTTITPEDFEGMTPVEAHVLNYPDHADKMDWSVGLINGVDRKSYYTLEFVQWESFETPIVRYPEIPNLFNEFETIVVGIGKHGESYVTDIIAPTVTTNIVNLQTQILRHESVTTKRISVDLSGEGDAIFISDTFGPAENNVLWSVYAPVMSKLRVTLPQFSEDILTELPALEATGDQPFNQLSVDDYNMSYDEFYKTRLKGDFYFRPKYLRSTDYVVDELGSGRKAVDPLRALKRRGIRIPGL